MLTPNLILLRDYMPEDDLAQALPCISHFARDGKDLRQSCSQKQ